MTTINSTPVDKGAVTTALLVALREFLDPVPIGDAERPSGLKDRATYGVLTRVTTGRAREDMTGGHGLQIVKHQITAVSQSRRAADELIRRAGLFLFERVGKHGDFRWPIELEGHTITNRTETVSLTGAANDNNNLFQFDLLVSRDNR